MAHYFDVISCEIKCSMHAEFSLLFGLHTVIFLLSKLP